NTTSKVFMEFQCAVTCKENRALYFTFNGSASTCTIFGSGQVNSSISITYINSPQPTMLEEVAHGQNTYASPQWGSYFKQLAVDGNQGTASMYACADYTLIPWWIVDLNQ
ncbi:hypothetical protein OTU49_006644, partial [Cherax quadricarinatus]